MTVPAELRLSALRAFLGRIHPEMRRIAVAMQGSEIVVTVTVDRPPSARVVEDVSEAATEIVADFLAPVTIREQIDVVTGPLPSEDIFERGLLYERAE